MINEKLFETAADLVGETAMGIAVLADETTTAGTYEDAPPPIFLAATNVAQLLMGILITAEEKGVTIPTPTEESLEAAERLMKHASMVAVGHLNTLQTAYKAIGRSGPIGEWLSKAE